MERVVDSGWFILGPEVEAFERELATAFEAREAVAVANGTEALQLALTALGLGPGDEVVTTSLSAAFTGLAILSAGARPVFVDVDPGTLNLDPGAVARAVTPRTRAILPVHLLRPARGHGPDPGLCPRARDPGGRGRLPGPRGASQGPDGGDPGNVRRALLLPDQEPRRPR